VITNETGADFEVTGDLLSNDDFTNETGADLRVKSGAFTGIDTLSNAGSLDLSIDTTLMAGSSITNTGVITSLGTLDGPLINTNEVTAQGGLMGATQNNGGSAIFTVGGDLSGDSSFFNDAGATLNVSGGDFTGLTTVTNNGTLNVETGRTLSAFSITNNSTVPLINQGDMVASSDIVNSGEIINSGTLSASSIANTTGATLSNSGNISGNVSNSGAFSNGSTISGDVTNTGNFDFSAGMVAGDVSNSGTTNLSAGSSVLITDDFTNTGTLNVLGDAEIGNTFDASTGLINSAGTATLTTGGATLSNTVIALRDGAEIPDFSDVTTIIGDVTSRGTLTVLVEADLSQNNALNEQVSKILRLTDTLDADEVEIFVKNTGGSVVLQDNPLTIVQADTATETTSINVANVNSDLTVVLPDGSTETFEALNTNAAVEYVAVVDPANGTFSLVGAGNAAFSGVNDGISALQQIVGSVVNRPTSPFITSKLSFGEDDVECGYGTWARFTGGKVKADTSSTTPGRQITTDMDLSYRGAQVGADFRCDTFDPDQWNFSGGLTFGYNLGSVEQDVVNTTISSGVSELETRISSDFEQAYGSVYFNASRGNFFGDLQLGYDKTDFEISDLTPGGTSTYSNNSVDSNSTTFGGSIGFAFPLENDFFIVPQAGFRLSRIQYGTLVSGDVTSQDFSTLMLDDRTAKVGFAGVSVGQTTVSEDASSVLNKFMTVTIYNDFSSDQTAQFTQVSSGTASSRTLTASGIGTFGEINAGVSYTRIYDEGEFGSVNQLDASLRADYKIGSDLSGSALTAQIRFQF